jgi:hypothetical protein
VKTHRVALLILLSACLGLACEGVLGLSGTTVIVGADGSADEGTGDSGELDARRDTEPESDANLDAGPDSPTDAGTDSAPEAGTCPALRAIGSMGCVTDEECCQVGVGIPVGASCLTYYPPKSIKVSECVTRCNSISDCPNGTCCVYNSNSVNAKGRVTEPGGWCLSPELTAEAKGKCVSGCANDSVCLGTSPDYACDAAPD